MNSVPFDAVPQEQWDTLVMRSPDGWPFALSSWRRLILAVCEWQLEDRSFAVFDSSEMCAVVPMQLDHRSRALGMTGWGGCGPIIAGQVSARHRDLIRTAVVGMVDEAAAKLDAKALHFSLPPVTVSAIENGRGVNPYAFCGLEDCSGIAQVIDLSADEVSLWRGLSETARQTVRKAEKGGIVVVEADWGEMLNRYYRIHEENYLRTGVTPHPISYFSGIANEMAVAGHSVLWAALDQEGEAIAFHNDMHFGAGVWYHTGCSTEAGLATGANYLLFWRSMLGARAAGRQWYDCGEIFPVSDDKKRNGLTLFKTRFGGQPHRFLKASKNYNSREGNAVSASVPLPASCVGRLLQMYRRVHFLK
jgi:hypothetical protein